MDLYVAHIVYDFPVQSFSELSVTKYTNCCGQNIPDVIPREIDVYLYLRYKILPPPGTWLHL
jgi:hypothetical protein